MSHFSRRLVRAIASNQRQKTIDVVKVHGLGLSKVEGSGIPGGEVKFIDTRRKTDGEGISLSLS